MAYELISTSVTSSLVVQLGEIFPGVTRYRETIPLQSYVYPHFFIHQLTLETQRERRDCWIVNYLATIRYHVAEDPSSVTGSLQEQLDEASIKLISELDCIYWDGIQIKVSNPRTEKIDGVLHYFCNVSVMAKKEREQDPLQETLKTEITKQ